MKICHRCKKEKDESEFGEYKRSRDKLSVWCKLCHKIYYQENKKNITKQQQEYQKQNKEVINKYKKQWYIDNADDAKKRIANNKLKRRHSDAGYKLEDNIKSLIWHSLKNQHFSKKSRTYILLGCSYEDFITYLGPKPDGNTHLDHICPCSQAQNEEELIKLQHYTNFRWLSKEENLRKSDNWTPEAEQQCIKLLNRPWIT